MLAKLLCLPHMRRLARRFREQARSHIGSAVFRSCQAEVLTNAPELLDPESCNACNNAAVAVCNEAEVLEICDSAEATSAALASASSCLA